MQPQALTVGPFEENCWLIADSGSAQSVLIDPGDDADVLLAAIDATQTTLTAIWLTHAHLDHVGAIDAVRRRWDVPVYLHPDDLPLYRTVDRQAARFGLAMSLPPEPTQPLSEGDVMRCGALSFTVWHLPGHAPGHVAFVGHGYAFSGDCLFAGSIGRTDLPLADPAALLHSLDRLASLDPGTVVCAGHGPSTTIARERASNPFLAGRAHPKGAAMAMPQAG
jgi:hydroxyacylglutathione hydrolase